MDPLLFTKVSALMKAHYVQHICWCMTEYLGQRMREMFEDVHRDKSEAGRVFVEERGPGKYLMSVDKV